MSDQQEERERQREKRQQDGMQAPIVSARRRQLELARVDLVNRLQGATGPYRDTLQRALEALEAELGKEAT